MLLEVLARVAGVVGQILKDPIGFLGNLIQAVKQGFLNFMKNIGKHLQAGLIGWLTGTMAEAGIQLPEKFDLKGIFSLAMQLLGFTYEVIRAQAVKRLGENKVSRVEQTVEVFRVLASQGIAGMWQFVQDRLGDLNTLVIEPIKNFVIEKVMTAGIEWILSLLTPASAFIKAAKAIYEIVKFFIERAGQIADLINAILDAIGAIANGSLDQAIKGVENALAKSLPVVISFLASLLGLGGIATKIQAIFQKLRKPMEKAVDWIIDKGAKAFKKIGNKLKNSKLGKKAGKLKDSAKEKYQAGKQWVEDKKEAGQQWVSDKKAAAENWVEHKKGAVKEKFDFGNKVKDEFAFGKDKKSEVKNKEKEKITIPDGPVGKPVKFNAQDEGHRLWIELKSGTPVVMVASTPEQAKTKLDNIVGEIKAIPNLPPDLLAKAGELLRRGYGLLNVTEEQIDQQLDKLKTHNNSNIVRIREQIDQRANSVPQRNELAHVFQELFEILYNAIHLPEQRSAEGAVAWYHSQIREAMGSVDDAGQDTSGFKTGEGKNQRTHKIPNMLVAVVDQDNNNQAYFGMSAGGKKEPNQKRLDNAYPQFQDKLNQLSDNRPLKNRELTNCAECEAYDKAISNRGRDNADFSGLKDSAAWGPKETLKPEPRCDNCEYLYEEHKH